MVDGIAVDIGWMGWWHLPILIEKCYPELNDFEEIDVAAQGLVVVVGFRSECTHRPGHNAWEFGILSSLEAV